MLSTDKIRFVDSVVERTLGLRQLPIAETRDQAEAWYSCKLSFWIRQSECLNPIDDILRNEAHKACSVWKEAEQTLHALHSISLTDVYQMLSQMRGLMDTHTDSQRIMTESPEWMQSLHGHLPVKNMGWIHSFMLLLPVLDREYAAVYQGVAKTMIASLYTFWWSGRIYEYPRTTKPNIDWAYVYAFDE